MDKKICCKCGVEKPLNEFPTYSGRGKKRKRNDCKPCYNSRKKKYHVNKNEVIDNLIGMKFGRLTVIGKNYDYIDPLNGHRKLRWECLCECGNVTYPYRTKLLNKVTTSCGCFMRERSGEDNPAWRGGKYVDRKGYVYIRKDGDYISEHRYIYEQYYNIKLKKHQNIHHINGNRMDNRIENLELWETSQPKGQRVDDKIRFYFNLVKEYENHPLYKNIIDECKNMM